ncbi:MAG: Gfo/Idh/MocA family oxidoreductase, partial [Clostridiales bacterium]|nr:Gfo/Idh/MocA family oxidoreductase [Clostridiales bacterium]
MSKVRYGVIGIGKMGSQHAKRLLLGQDKNATLTAVADTNATRRDWAESNLKNVSIFDNAEDLINCKEVDAVIIATPHYDHPKLGIKALQAGKHVLVEKPIGVYTKAVKELYEEAKKHPELTFGIMYNQRTDP